MGGAAMQCCNRDNRDIVLQQLADEDMSPPKNIVLFLDSSSFFLKRYRNISIDRNISRDYFWRTRYFLSPISVFPRFVYLAESATWMIRPVLLFCICLPGMLFLGKISRFFTYLPGMLFGENW